MSKENILSQRRNVTVLEGFYSIRNCFVYDFEKNGKFNQIKSNN